MGPEPPTAPTRMTPAPDLPESRPTDAAPLAGLRVVDFTHVLAGPACAYFLGLLGAEVVKVEGVDGGDAMRVRGGTDAARAADGMSTAYLTQAAGKRGIAVDLAREEGAAVMHRLLATADVLVENHRPESLAALGLDEGSVRARHPALIHCAITGYGRGGPLGNAPAYDVNVQAASGLMTLTGTAESGPTRTGAPVMDYGVAMAASFAVCAALHRRAATGEGAFVDVSMLETAFTLMGSTVTDYLATGTAPAPRGNAANSRSPGAGSFPCREGVLSLGVNEERQFRALARTLGREAWLDDPRFADRDARARHAAELEVELAERLLTGTAEDWEARMLEVGVPAARVRTLPESLALEQTEARAYLHRDEESGVAVPTLPFRIGDARTHAPRGGFAPLGRDTRAVLAELGYAAREIESMVEAGIVLQAEGERRP